MRFPHLLTTVAALTMLSLVVLPGCKSQGSARPSTSTAISILRHQTGSDAGFKLPGVVLVKNAQQLQNMGSTELSKLDVSFDKESLVVLALGEQKTGGYWARITGIQITGSTLWVQGIANRPAEGAVVTQAITYPYAVAVIAKSNADKVMSEIESTTGAPLPPEAPAIAAPVTTAPAK